MENQQESMSGLISGINDINDHLDLMTSKNGFYNKIINALKNSGGGAPTDNIEQSNINTPAEESGGISSIERLTKVKEITKKLISASLQLFDTVQGMRTETGFLVGQLEGAEVLTGKLVIDNMQWGASAEDVQNSIKAMTDTYGSLRGYNQDIISDMVQLNARLGIGTEALAKTSLYLESAGIGAQNMSKFIEDTVMSISKNDGTSMKQNMEAIANASDDTLAFMGKTPAALVSAVSYASKLKLEMDTIAGMATGLLSIESSIEAQMKANVLTGRNMNFEKARELALQGDLEGMADTMLDQLGSVSEFQTMNYFQQKAIADATGLSVKELRTSLTLREQEYNMTEKQRHAQDTIQTGVQQLKNMWEGIKKSIFVPFIPVLEQINKLSKNIGNSDTEVWKNLASVLRFVAEGFTYVLTGTLKVINVLTSAEQTFKNTFTSWGDGLKAVIGIATAFFALRGGFTSFFTFIPKLISKSIGGLVKGITKPLADVTKGITSTISSVTSSISKGFVNVLTNIGKGIAGMFNALSSAAANPLAFAAVGLLTAFTGAIIGLGYAMKLATPAFKVFFDFLSGAVSSVFKSLPKIIDSISNGINKVMKTFIDMAKVGPQLFVAAAGMTALGVSLLSFGGLGTVGLIAMSLGLSGFAKSLSKVNDEFERLNKEAVKLDSIESNISLKTNKIDFSLGTDKNNTNNSNAITNITELNQPQNNQIIKLLTELTELTKKGNNVSIKLDGKELVKGISKQSKQLTIG